jgi:pyruvate/2-oxoacid:ferredoxin oxidoreductase beta subunit
MVIGVPPGCMAGVGVHGWGEEAGTKVPTVMPLLSNSGATMSGIKEGLARDGNSETTVVAFAGDGATADVGFQSVSGAAERNENIVYIMYNNEGYMNTGIQRSSTTPKYAETKTTPVGEEGQGKEESQKPVSMLMAMHDISYTATANVAYPVDFKNKLTRADEATEEGMAFIEVFVPCTIGWEFSNDETVSVAKKATETNMFPLWEVDDGELTFTESIEEPEPLPEYLDRVGKYAHLSQEEIDAVEQNVDQHLDWLEGLRAD